MQDPEPDHRSPSESLIAKANISRWPPRVHSGGARCDSDCAGTSHRAEAPPARRSRDQPQAPPQRGRERSRSRRRLSCSSAQRQSPTRTRPICAGLLPPRRAPKGAKQLRAVEKVHAASEPVACQVLGIRALALSSLALSMMKRRMLPRSPSGARPTAFTAFSTSSFELTGKA